MASSAGQIASTLSYSSTHTTRVLLKTILTPAGEDGSGWLGRRVLVGGWVKSFKEVFADADAPKDAVHPPPSPHDDVSSPSCLEILQCFRTIVKVLGGGVSHPGPPKLDSVNQDPPPTPPPQPSSLILQLNDGSCLASLQVLVDSSTASSSKILPTGTCILVQGTLQKLASGQRRDAVELKADGILHVGTVDQDYNSINKRIKDIPHLRPRTNTMGSVARIRDALNQATHSFFMDKEFLKRAKEDAALTKDDSNPIGQGTVKASFNKVGKKLEEHKGMDKSVKMDPEEIPKPATSSDLSGDFFSCQTYLTVSGRLHLEIYACSLGNVYSFGPRFRAQTSESKQHAPEMWMVEVEMGFSQLEDAMICACDLLNSVSKWALENCSDDLKFLATRTKTIMDRLQSMTSSPFQRISYEEAVAALKQVKDKKFKANIEFGMPLTTEQESYLADEIYKKPVVIHTYCKDAKPFYVRLNDDEQTVAAFDIVIPKAGTLIRGSQNEERFDVLNKRIKELGLPDKQYDWYLDLQRNGTVSHSGFCLMFDLLVACVTGFNDVKDVVELKIPEISCPYSRTGYPHWIGLT
ncbi:asparagine--tRNA ligase, cytoplasmic 2-like isoform X2 [Diospyros lotus]|uniref:asparagine--tRNA ligase, cytoplasmic 2-like isoform X2 n=1 Tax=Diospyros lotus TaxID=55363 RepID=UPI00225793C9|nr:asparagine--tRNA ligase, cytoplasmic 2-like isoform X2 [Diospyros lotus]